MEWLDKFRNESMQKFQSLPAENSELFKHKTFFKDFDLGNVDKTEIQFDTKFFREPESEKVSIVPLKDYLDHSQKFLEKNKIDDKFVQMNNAMFNSGLIIHVPKGAHVKNDIRLYSKIEGNVFTKIIVLAEEDSKLNIVKEDFSEGEEQTIFSESIEIFLKDGAELGFSNIQNLRPNVKLFTNKIVNCDRGSKMSWNIGHFGGGKVRSRVYNIMRGEGANVEDLEVAFGTGTQEFDMFSNLTHIGRFSSGKILSKSITRDRSQSLFKGMIRIEESAKNANSYLAGHSMLLSKTSNAQAIPGLEILTNDVKATHSASVSPIDNEKIFYLESRGLTRDEAIKTISLGFIEPILGRISSEEIKSKIKLLLELKWSGQENRFLEMLDKAEADNTEAVASKDIFEGHYKYR